MTLDGFCKTSVIFNFPELRDWTQKKKKNVLAASREAFVMEMQVRGGGILKYMLCWSPSYLDSPNTQLSTQILWDP